jgi:hypothetical protein
MSKNTSDALRLLKIRLNNQKLSALAITNQFANQNENNDGVVADSTVDPVQLYQDATGNDFTITLYQHFIDLLKKYVSDPALIDDLFQEVGLSGAQEFVLNFNNYAPKLKKVEGQRFNRSTFIVFFKDMLSESLVKKGLVHGMQNNALKNMGGANSSMPTPKFVNLQLQQLNNPQISHSPFTPISQSQSPNNLKGSPALNFQTLYPNVASPTIQQPSPPPLKPSPPPPSPQTVHVDSGAEADKAEASYGTVLANAINSFSSYLGGSKVSKDAIKAILTTHFQVHNLTNRPDPVNPNKMIAHNKGSLRDVLMNKMQDSFNKDEYTTIQNVLKALKLIPQTKQKLGDSNLYDVLYMSKADWIADRRDKAVHGIYKGYGLASLKPHHVVLGKYFIDRKKLGNGIFDLRYAKNKHLTNIKPQFVSENLKQVINQILDEKKVSKANYHKLNNHEQHLVRNLNNIFDLGEDLEDDDSYDERFQIVLGELKAGNTSMALKQEAKRYILHAMSIGKLPRNVGMNLLMEFNI